MTPFLRCELRSLRPLRTGRAATLTPYPRTEAAPNLLGADNTQDRFYDTNSQFDFSATQKITRNLHGYVNLLNLNDSLLRYFQSVPERVLQEEHYHWWAEFGVKIKF